MTKPPRMNRRQFLETSALAAALPAGGAPAGAQTRALAEWSGVPPSEMILALDDRRLLATVQDAGVWKHGPLKGVVSTDAGRTWSAPYPYMQEGRPFAATIFPARPVARLRDGRLAIVYSEEAEARFGSYWRTWRFATSADEGKNWSAGHVIDAPAQWDQDMGIFGLFPWGHLIELAGGRLVFPAYWYMGGRHPELPPAAPYPVRGLVGGRKVGADGHLFEGAMGGCFAYYSDDRGKSWRRSTGSIMVWPLPQEEVGGFGATWEPVVVELKDGAVLMLLRANVGQLFKSISRDGGRRWSRAEPTGLASGDVPCTIGRLPGSKDLVVVWNQASRGEIRRGYSRGRLSLAISRDEARTWSGHRTLELSAGLAPVDRVPPEPVRHVRSNVDLGVLPDGYSRYHYPGIASVQGKLVVVYRTASYRGADQRGLRLSIVQEARLTA